MKTKMSNFLLSVALLSFLGSFVIIPPSATGATLEKKLKKRHISEDVPLEGTGDRLHPAQARGIWKYPEPGKTYDVTCEDINPEAGVIIQHDQVGHTWYDFQKNGSVGRMISVTPDGYRHFSWTFTDGPYPSFYRYVSANCQNPFGEYPGQVEVDGGENKSAGYSNQAHLHDGRSVISYHRNMGQEVDPVTGSMLSIEDSLCGSYNLRWDIPDSILFSCVGGLGYWPKLAVLYDDVQERDYIHVIVNELDMTASWPMLVTAYQRCFLDQGDTLVCQTYAQGSTLTYRLAANTNYSAPSGVVGSLDSTCSINAVPVVSPVSRRVAVAFIKPACDGTCDYLGDIAFVESMDNGEDWIDGTNYPPPEFNVTNYGCNWPEDERAHYDLNACYDYNDSLHIVWSTVGFPEPYYIQPGLSRLRHWSKNTGVVWITGGVWSGTDPGSYNANIAKMSISAMDPVFHPGGTPDSVYLFCTFTQFDSGDNSNALYTNGEIYLCGSANGGLTWGPSFNLTQTHTPDCTPGNCVSEHWSSLAQNMYDGNLHIQYICDRHPGFALNGQDEGSVWVDNPVMYLEIEPPFIPGCEHPPDYTLTEPASWHKPPIKVTPGGSRNLTIMLTNYTGCPEITYSVTSDHPCVQISDAGVLFPGQSVTVNGMIDGGGECSGTFIQGTVTVTLGYEYHYVPVHAVVADDYYECPVDPETFDTVETGAARVYVNANSMEWIHDVSSYPDTVHEVFLKGGSIVATSIDGHKAVGRFMGDNDFCAGVRDKLYTDWCEYDDDYDCWVIYTKDIFINSPSYPPNVYHCYWWWWEWSKQIKVCELENRIMVIEYVTVKRHDPPSWWPAVDPPCGEYAGHEDTYVGMAMDIDCPWDTLGEEHARNLAGYDEVNHIAWQQGFDYTGAHPEYNDYYAGMALADPEGNPANWIPYSSHNVKNNVYLYPQAPWGWDDEELYDLCATPGYTVQDVDSLADRSQVLVAKYIPSGYNPDAETSFVVVEVATPNGLNELQVLVDSARAMVVREHDEHGFPMICGDVNGNYVVNVEDAIYILNYLFRGGDPVLCPQVRGDVKPDGIVDLSDSIRLLNYLFKDGDPPDCPGIW